VPTPSVVIELTRRASPVRPRFVGAGPRHSPTALAGHHQPDGGRSTASRSCSNAPGPAATFTPSAPGKLVVRRGSPPTRNWPRRAPPRRRSRVREPERHGRRRLVVLGRHDRRPAVARRPPLPARVLDSNLDSWTLEIKRTGQQRRSANDRHRRPSPSRGGRLATPGTWRRCRTASTCCGLTARDIGSRLARTEAVVEVRTATKHELRPGARTDPDSKRWAAPP